MINAVKNLLRTRGFDLIKYDARRDKTQCLFQLFRKLSVDCVLDVGANSGQYGKELRSAGFSDKLISFEPLGEPHALLSEAASGDSNWLVADRCAIGEESGSVSMQVSGNSVSSSILDMTDTHVDAAPSSAYVGTEEVPIKTLDQALQEMTAAKGNFHLKIDTQGYERFVINGATETLKNVSVIEMEVSLVPLYDGGWLIHEALSSMADLGFRAFAVFPFFCDQQTGETYQMDIIFTKIDHVGGAKTS